MKIINCEQGSDAWRLARLGLATASCFSDILAQGKGVSRRNYRLRLTLERLTGISREGFKSPAMERGTEREAAACAAYEHRTGLWLTEVGFIRHDKLEAGASPDRLAGKRVVEVKAPEPAAHLAVLQSRAVPSEYVAQVQGEIWIAEAPDADFVSYCPEFPERHRLVIVPVKRDEAYIDRLRTEVALFLEEVRAEVAALKAMP